MLRRLLHIFMAAATVIALSACSSDDDGQEASRLPRLADCYVNFAISIDNGEAITRANTPAGGENGDGREAGFERENTLTGITVILYKDATGINTTNDPTLDFVRYYSVSLGGRDTQGTTYAAKTPEAYYTTGNQPIGTNSLDLTATYHVIVIANSDLTTTLTEGTSKLSNVRDLTLSTIYTGSATESASACTNFVMSSEQDNTVNFSSAVLKNLDGTFYTAGKEKVYDLTAQPVVIERMAARIDFWSKNSNGYMTSTENAAYTTPGYEYNVEGSTDKFVVTGIVPFNLTNGHADYGSEYLIKRLRTTISDGSTTSYLADEGTATWVIDPKTMDKGTAVTPALTSSLESVYGLIGDASKLESTTDNPYYHSIASMHGVSSATSTIDSKENVVVAYPMENCLQPDSKPYYHATGVAIVGYYYVNGTGTGTRYVYLTYLHHQGDAETYDVQPYTTALPTDATMGSTTAMKFGIVRNNIYRININKIDKKGSAELAIKVKKWDTFTHSWIYM